MSPELADLAAKFFGTAPEWGPRVIAGLAAIGSGIIGIFRIWPSIWKSKLVKTEDIGWGETRYTYDERRTRFGAINDIRKSVVVEGMDIHGTYDRVGNEPTQSVIK